MFNFQIDLNSVLINQNGKNEIDIIQIWHKSL